MIRGAALPAGAIALRAPRDAWGVMSRAAVVESIRPQVEVHLLDGFRIVGASAGQLTKSGRRLIALLALRGRSDRSAVAGTLWPDASEEHAHGALRSALWRVNCVSDGLVRASRVTLDLRSDVDVDVRRIEQRYRLLRSGRHLDDDADLLGLSSGELLPGWDDDWVLLERERLRQVQLASLCDIARAFLENGEHDNAVMATFRVLRLEVLRESTHRLLIEVHIDAGNYGEAIREFRQWREFAARELGVRPSPHMYRLIGSIAPAYAASVSAPTMAPVDHTQL
jgi:DNA-binding SARP family transcriptional activator